jgi:hypothetical protein
MNAVSIDASSSARVAGDLGGEPAGVDPFVRGARSAGALDLLDRIGERDRRRRASR